MRLQFDLKPVPKQSFRFFRKAKGKKQGFPETKVKNFRDQVIIQAKEQLPPNWKPTELPILIHYLQFSFPPLKKFKPSLLQIIRAKTISIGKPTRPDLDNLLKSFCDALNGIAWKDDAQIVEILRMRKIYGPPKIDIEFFEIDLLEFGLPVIPTGILRTLPISPDTYLLNQNNMTGETQ